MARIVPNSRGDWWSRMQEIGRLMDKETPDAKSALEQLQTDRASDWSWLDELVAEMEAGTPLGEKSVVLQLFEDREHDSEVDLPGVKRLQELERCPKLESGN